MNQADMARKLFRLFPFFLILYEFCTNMSNDMYLPALPLIAHDFDLDLSIIQLTIAAWLAGNTFLQLLIGPLSDRYGRRRVLLTGGGVFLLATVGSALAPSISALILARFLQGVGVCSMMIAGYASIHDLYDDERAIHILVWMGSAAIIAPAIGPVLGGLLLLITGWRAIFWVLALLSAFSLGALWLSMPESIKELHPLKISVILSRYRRIFLNSHFMVSAASFGLLYAGVIAWITASPFILMVSLKVSPAVFGYLQVPVFCGYIVGAKLVKPLLTTFGQEALIVGGSTISLFAAAFLTFFAGVAPTTLYSFILPMAFYTAGFGLAAAPLNRITITATKEQKGSAMAMFYLIMMGSGTLVSLALSVVKNSTFYPCALLGATTFLACALNFFRRYLLTTK